MILYITGSLDEVLGPEHKKEIVRYLYNHQVYIRIYGAIKDTKHKQPTIDLNSTILLYEKTHFLVS